MPHIGISQRKPSFSAPLRILPVSFCILAAGAVKPGPDPAQVMQEGLPDVAHIPVHWTAPDTSGAPVQASEIATQADVIKMRNALLANRIDLHLALGGSFVATPAKTLFVEPTSVSRLDGK